MSSFTRNTKIKKDLRPTDFEYALLSQHVYLIRDCSCEVGKKFVTPFRTWIIDFVGSPTNSGYFGAVYKCNKTRQYVIAHRGTNNWRDYKEDVVGIVLNKCSAQKREAFQLVSLVIEKIRSGDDAPGTGLSDQSPYTLSFTGHSLGAFLAEMSVYFSTMVLNYPEVNAVTFESPGSRESMASICWHPDPKLSQLGSLIHSWSTSNINFSFSSSLTSSLTSITSLVKSRSSPSLKSFSSSSSSLSSVSLALPPTEFNTVLNTLDIISYVCYPNIVNVCNNHVGTLYAINVILERPYRRLPLLRRFGSHGINGIVDWFIRAEVDLDSKCTRLHMSDWPKGVLQSEVFYKYASTGDDGLLRIEGDLLVEQGTPPPLRRSSFKSFTKSSQNLEKWVKIQRKRFELRLQANFKVTAGVKSNVLPLHHFSKEMQQFLYKFQKALNLLYKNNEGYMKPEEIRKRLAKAWTRYGCELRDILIHELLEYKIQLNKTHVDEVVCRRMNVHKFRQELSCWLERTGVTIQELINNRD